MFRSRLIGAALLSLTLLSGCGLLTGDRPRICERCADRRAGRVNAAPVGYTGADAGCGSTVIPPGGTPYGQPIFIGPGGGVMPGAETLPPPMGGSPRIPKAGIEEKGKQFELEGGSRGGPVLTIPASNIKP